MLRPKYSAPSSSSIALAAAAASSISTNAIPLKRPVSRSLINLTAVTAQHFHVGNLNYKVRESDLQKVMEDYGAVTAVKFIKDRETGRFRGIAFVEMEDAAAAAKAIEELDGAEYFGRNMVVKEARPPKY